jgi:hypothetical protein
MGLVRHPRNLIRVNECYDLDGQEKILDKGQDRIRRRGKNQSQAARKREREGEKGGKGGRVEG